MRDIEVLEAGGAATAYVGTFAGTIHKIAVQPAQLQEQLDATWPVTIPLDHVTGLSLANYGVGPQLFVASGPAFHVERQFWGVADKPVPCDQRGRGSRLEGILQYDLTTGALEGVVHRVESNPNALQGHPIAISTRPVLSNLFAPTILIDVACDVGGIQLFRSDYDPFLGWTLAKTSVFGAGDGVALGAYDDVLLLSAGPVLRPFAIAARESGIAVFDPDPNMGVSPLDSPVRTAGGGAILLTGFDYDPGDLGEAMVFGSAHTKGAHFFQVLGGGSIVNWGYLNESNDRVQGRCVEVFATRAPAADSFRRWLYVPLDDDLRTGSPGGGLDGGLRVYRIDAQDPDPQDPLKTPELGSFTQDPAIAPSTNPPTGHGTYIGCYAIDAPQTTDQQIVWIGYNSSASMGAWGMGEFGLLTFQAVYDPVVDIVQFTVVNRIHLCDQLLGQLPPELDPSNTSMATLTYDAPRKLLYMAMGTGGVARFDVSTPSAPLLAGYRPSPSPSAGDYEVVIQVGLAANNRLFVPFMSTGQIGILDASTATTFASGTMFVHPTPFQAISVWPLYDPTLLRAGETAGQVGFLGTARGGLHRVSFPPGEF